MTICRWARCFRNECVKLQETTDFEITLGSCQKTVDKESRVRFEIGVSTSRCTRSTYTQSPPYHRESSQALLRSFVNLCRRRALHHTDAVGKWYTPWFHDSEIRSFVRTLGRQTPSQCRRCSAPRRRKVLCCVANAYRLELSSKSTYMPRYHFNDRTRLPWRPNGFATTFAVKHGRLLTCSWLVAVQALTNFQR